MRKTMAVLAAVAVAIMATGCGQNPFGPAQSAGKALTLPPSASMSMAQLDAGRSTAGSLGKTAVGPTCYAASTAYLVVSFWTVGVAAALATPKVLFDYCRSATPVRLDDNSGWQWTVGDNVNTAVLTGKVFRDSVRWTMTVSNATLQDFTWFEGTSTITGVAGYWTFYDTTRVASIRFDYAVGATGTVRATVVNPADTSFGCYLQWSATGMLKTFEAYDAKTLPPEKLIISSDESTGAGSIENVTKGEKYCWDTRVNGYQDIACQ